MNTFTFNECEHIGWHVKSSDHYNLMIKNVSYIIYLDPNGIHHFVDGKYTLDPSKLKKCQRNVSLKSPAGPILFVVATYSSTPTLLFQTREHYMSDNTPISVNLSECDLQFFDRDSIRDALTVISHQPAETLLPFEDILFKLCQQTEQERLDLIQSKYRHTELILEDVSTD